MKESFKEAYKRKLLETYDFTVAFLEDNNLRWWGTGGTAIGAARHQGLIPWDDDIDFCMLRSDYERLLLLRDKLLERGYDLISYQNDLNSNVFLKVSNRSTSLVAEEQDPFDTGVFIDIFPIDYYDGDEKSFYKEYKALRSWSRLYKYSCSLVSFKDFRISLIKRHYSKALKQFGRLLLPCFVRKIAKYKISLWHNKYSHKTDGRILVSFLGSYGAKEVLNKEWFEGYEIRDYENRKIKLLNHFDEHLRKLYGDYMTPPSSIPEISHWQYYVNLKEHLEFDEIVKRCSQGIYQEW